jgi:maltose O-acetyltransferase
MLSSKIYLKRLQHNGLKIGRNVYIMTPQDIDGNLCWLVSIGDDCVLSQDVLILAHDASTEKHLGYNKISKVTIGCRTYIGARAIILPGVNIGDDVIIGAGSVVTHDIPNNSVAVGNPARVIKSTSEYIEEHKKNLPTRSRRLRGKALQTSESKKFIQEELKKDDSYYI